MPPIATALVGRQFGIETTSGARIAANKKFPSLNIKMQPMGNFTEYDAEGVIIPVASILGQEWGGGDYSGPVDYNESPYIYNNGLYLQTRTQIDTSGAYRGIWIPSASAVQAASTWTVEGGDGQASLAEAYTYVAITDLSRTWNRKKVETKGKFIARRIITATNLTASPTTIARKPVLPQQIDFYLADTWAGLAAASVVDGGWEVDLTATAGRFGPTWPLDSSQTSWKELVAGKMKPKVKLSVAVNSASLGIFTTMRNGDVKYARLKATGAQIGVDASSNPIYYTDQWDFAFQVSKVPDTKDHEKVYSLDFEGTLVPSTESGHVGNWLEVTNTNALAAL